MGLTRNWRPEGDDFFFCGHRRRPQGTSPFRRTMPAGSSGHCQEPLALLAPPVLQKNRPTVIFIFNPRDQISNPIHVTLQAPTKSSNPGGRVIASCGIPKSTHPFSTSIWPLQPLGDARYGVIKSCKTSGESSRSSSRLPLLNGRRISMA